MFMEQFSLCLLFKLHLCEAIPDFDCSNMSLRGSAILFVGASAYSKITYFVLSAISIFLAQLLAISGAALLESF